MKKRTKKADRQQQNQQKQKQSRNQARYRERNDIVYSEANRDDLIRHQMRVGHAPYWIAVLNGSAPAIVLPVGEVDKDELERCRHLVSEMHGEAAPEEPYYEEFDQFLTPYQLDALGHTKPVIMMAYVERQFDTKLQRQNSLLQSRVRDAIEFGISQGIQYIGRLWLSIEEGKHGTADAASTCAVFLFSEVWAPQYTGEEAEWWSGYVEDLKGAGSLQERAQHFVEPAQTHELIKAEISTIRGVSSTTNIERRFWHTIILGLINCKDHDGPQATAHRRISGSLQTTKPVDRADILEFMGVTRAPVALIDLMTLAYFEMPDAYRLFPTFHFHAPDFEALAVLGALTRNRSVRVDAKTAARLAKILSYPTPANGLSSEKLPPEVLTPKQFLRHAMARVGSNTWWTHILQSTPDNFGVRHFRRGEDLSLVKADADSLALDDSTGEQVFTSLLRRLMTKFTFRFGEIDHTRTWQYLVPGNIMVVDFERVMESSRGDAGLAALNLVDALAAGIHRGLGLDEFQTMSAQLPGYYREMVRVAAASHTVMQVIAPRLCERRELDLRHYARFLTDREYQMAALRGETTGYRILEILGHNVLTRKQDTLRRQKDLEAEWAAEDRPSSRPLKVGIQDKLDAKLRKE